MFNGWENIGTKELWQEVDTWERRSGEKEINRILTWWHAGDGYAHATEWVSPDLVLQEMHVAVKQSVGGTQNSHWLHPRASFQLTLHGHVGETGQAEVAAFTEISVKQGEAEMKSGLTAALFTEPSRPCKAAVRGKTHMKSLVIRWEPLAMDLNSTPSRLMSWGRHHSTMFPALYTQILWWKRVPMWCIPPGELPLKKAAMSHKPPVTVRDEWLACWISQTTFTHTSWFCFLVRLCLLYLQSYLGSFYWMQHLSSGSFYHCGLDGPI